MPFDAFVISLPERKDRRDSLRDHLLDWNINPIFVKAINGKEQEKRYTFDKGNNYVGLIGCHLSHLTLWKHLVSHKVDALIMEDDCRLTDNPFDWIKRVKPFQTPIHLFGWSGYKTFKHTPTNTAGIVYPEFGLTTHCYFAKWQYLQPLIEKAEKLDTPIDVLTAQSNPTGNYPCIAYQEVSKSDITGQKADYRALIRT